MIRHDTFFNIVNAELIKMVPRIVGSPQKELYMLLRLLLRYICTFLSVQGK